MAGTDEFSHRHSTPRQIVKFSVLFFWQPRKIGHRNRTAAVTLFSLSVSHVRGVCRIIWYHLAFIWRANYRRPNNKRSLLRMEKITTRWEEEKVFTLKNNNNIITTEIKIHRPKYVELANIILCSHPAEWNTEAFIIIASYIVNRTRQRTRGEQASWATYTHTDPRARTRANAMTYVPSTPRQRMIDPWPDHDLPYTTKLT